MMNQAINQMLINHLFKKTFIAFGLLICLGVFTTTLFAGGWVVITMETLPGQIQAGEDVPISFWVRQHGQTPIHNVSPLVIGKAGGEEIRVEATKGKEVGLFEATLNFPTAGEWEWSIKAEPFPQTSELAPLMVLDPHPVTAAAGEQLVISEVRSAFGSLQTVMQAGGLALIGIAILLALRDRRRQRDEPVPISGD